MPLGLSPFETSHSKERRERRRTPSEHKIKSSRGKGFHFLEKPVTPAFTAFHLVEEMFLVECHPAATKGWVGGRCWGRSHPGAESGGRRWRQDGTVLADVVPATSDITLHYL